MAELDDVVVKLEDHRKRLVMERQKEEVSGLVNSVSQRGWPAPQAKTGARARGEDGGADPRLGRQ
jgi:hypothetical protein